MKFLSAILCCLAVSQLLSIDSQAQSSSSRQVLVKPKARVYLAYPKMSSDRRNGGNGGPNQVTATPGIDGNGNLAGFSDKGFNIFSYSSWHDGAFIDLYSREPGSQGNVFANVYGTAEIWGGLSKPSRSDLDPADNLIALDVRQLLDESGTKGFIDSRSNFSVSKTGDVNIGEVHYDVNDPTTYHSAYDYTAGVSTDGCFDGAHLNFMGGKVLDNTYGPENSDAIFMHRYNERLDRSVLRVNVGDDGYSGAPIQNIDKMELGFYADNGSGSRVWNPSVSLYANGEVRSNSVMHAKKVVVEGTVAFPDYVFKPSYRLAPLAEVEQKIKELGHLPGMPSAAEVEKNGMDLGEQNRLLVEKVEELTLHLIRMQKELDELNQKKSR